MTSSKPLGASRIENSTPLRIGACFQRNFPAPFVIEAAETLDRLAVDDLWIIEDCFFTAGIALAATALARTERLTIGLGILPAVARNPAITAMEIATLAELAPGRVIAGIGHGVQDWMAQMGAKSPSPLTTLQEVIGVVRRLLAGENVSFVGKHVQFDNVKLEAPPTVVPPVIAGVSGPKSLAMAGQVADGLVLAEGTGPIALANALHVALGASPIQRPSPFSTTVFTPLSVHPDRQTARALIAPFISTLIEARRSTLLELPFWNDMESLFKSKGIPGLVTMPADWWIELGAIGKMDDALQHLDALNKAGANRVALFPAPIVEVARYDLKTIGELAATLASPE